MQGETVNIFMFQCGTRHFTWRPAYVLLLPATWNSYKSIVAQHWVFLYSL